MKNKSIFVIEGPILMKNEKFIMWCDRAMAFSFYALIYFLPISIALAETFTGTALLSFFLKRGAMFYGDSRQRSSQGIKLPIWKKGCAFIMAFKPVPSCLNWPIAIFLFFNFISIFISQHPDVSLEGFLGKSLQSAFLYFNFIECINSKKRIKIFITTFFISCALVCTNGLVQHFHGEGFIRHSLLTEGRVSSSFRAPNDFGAYLVIAIPVLFCLFALGLRRQKQTGVQGPFDSFTSHFCKLRVVTLIVFVLATICLGLTYSRGAWIGFVLSLVLIGVTNRKLLLPFMLIGIVFLSVFFPKLGEKRAPIHDKKSFLYENNRLKYWNRASDIIQDYPLFGSGLNTYSLVSQRYTAGWGGYPHNSYLQLTSETGMVGISAFLWIIIVLFKSSFQALKKMEVKSQRLLFLGVLTGLLGFLIHSFFDTSFYSVQLGSLMWLIIGLIVVIARLDPDKEIIGNV